MGKKLFGLERIRVHKQESIIPARCTETRKSFSIVLGYEKGKLTMQKGVKSNEATSCLSSVDEKNGLKTIDLSNGLSTSRTYHCPICGNKDIVRCGKCHRITCYNGKGVFKCAFCGNSGKVSGTMHTVEVYNPDGFKKDGMKPQNGLKYYPGDK